MTIILNQGAACYVWNMEGEKSHSLPYIPLDNWKGATLLLALYPGPGPGTYCMHAHALESL